MSTSPGRIVGSGTSSIFRTSGPPNSWMRTAFMRLVGRPRPDAAVVHQADLLLDDLLPVLGVLHGRPLQVEVLRVDRLLVHDLVELGAQVLHPVVPLGPGAMVAHRLDVDDASHVGRAGAVVLAAD